MMNLFEINEEINKHLDMLSVDENGEIVDDGTYEVIQQLELDKAEKIENTALFIKNMNALEDALKVEKKNLDERIKVTQKKADRAKKYLAYALNGEKFESVKCKVSFRNTKSVNVYDEEILDDAYVTVKTTTTPNKTAIKQAIEDGVEVSGAFIESKQSVVIK